MKNKFVLVVSLVIVSSLVGVFLLYSQLKETPLFQRLSNPQTTARDYTLSELAQHSSQEDCYIAYKDQVFNLTWFISKHKGGLQILALCGQQADEFSAEHPGGSFDKPQIQAILQLSQVGTLVK